MTQGYLVMAQGEIYARQAEHLARSITSTQTSINKLSIITDQTVDATLFDKVILIENDLAVDSTWKIENRVNFYDLTPYDETVILDSDMLFLTDVSHWWKMLNNYDLLLTNKVLTYRGETVSQSPYRSTFRTNQLPDVYSAFAYFKKSGTALEFFTLVKSIVLNWSKWTQNYAPVAPQKFPSIDLAMAIALKVLDIEDSATSKLAYPTFTHMKGYCQGWKQPIEEWNSVLGIYNTAGKIKLGPYEQTGILHYVKKDFYDSIL
jgi:hypothetical protein